MGTTASMNFCPVKPGWTVISSTMSRSASTGRTTSSGESGLTATAAFFPSARMRATVFGRSGTASTWTLMRSAPARAKSSRKRSGSTIIRWRSSGICVHLRIAFTTAGPMVMLGTNWPSMTSTCSMSAPAASTAFTSSPRRAKSAARIDGAIRMGRGIDGGTYINDGVSGPSFAYGGTRISFSRASGSARSCRRRPIRCPTNRAWSWCSSGSGRNRKNCARSGCRARARRPATRPRCARC